MKNYEQMLISQHYNEATKKVADFQQYMNDAKQMTTLFAQSAGAQYVQNTIASRLSSEEMEALQNGNQASITKERWSEIQGIAQTATVAGNQVTAAMAAVTDSIFQQANKTQLAKLQAEASSLELKKDALASQVKILTEEYQAVKSSEDQAAKSAAPEFGVV